MRSLTWRRHRVLVILAVAGLLVLAIGFGDARITAITSSERTSAELDVTYDIQGTVDLFDDGVVHEIEVSFDPAEYARMIETFQEEGEKEYVEASITIDGTVIPSVGLRLKGNSTLMPLRGGGPGGLPGQEEIQEIMSCLGVTIEGTTGQGEATPVAGTPTAGSPVAAAPAGSVPAGDTQPSAGDMAPAAGAIPGAAPSGDGTPAAGNPAAAPPEGGMMGGMGMGGNVSADDPASLPWLIRFDEIVDGQRYQGLREIAIRPTQTGETMLNEALAQSLVAVAGEPTERTAYTAFTVNGSAADLRLVLEVPGDAYAARNFTHDGVLYKAQASGRFEYLGDDPTLYTEAFSQETQENRQDLAPLISFLKWVEEAEDAEFAAGLADRLDVASFARYIALQELLGNFDDMAGPGSNYYLWYDLESQRFTVLVWDLNLALADFGGGGGGPGGEPGAGGPDDGVRIAMPGMRANLALDDIDPAKLAECLPSDMQRMFGEQGDGGDMPRGRLGGNTLKERFLATPAFQELYAAAYAEVYEALYGDNGQALSELDRLAAVVSGSGLVEAATLEAEISALQTRLAALSAGGPIPASTTPSPAPPAASPASE